MAFCRFTDDYLLLDVTAVDNIFLEEYMLRAPGDYVKVYLFGLRLCYNRNADASLERMAILLGLEEETVLSAYDYWERQGLVRRLKDNPPQYEYINLRRALLQSEQSPVQSEVYSMGGFNSAVSNIMKGRLLHGEDFARMYSWMDDYGFSDKSVLSIVSHLVKENKKRGRNVPTVNAIEKRIRDLAEKHIISDDAVGKYLFMLGDDYRGAKTILTHLSIRRDPTEDELGLFQKWRAWGFDLESVKLLSEGMVNIREPNMGYLDKIVESYNEIGLIDSAEIARYKADNINPLKEVISALGGDIRLNRELILKYNGWIEAGFHHDLIIWAAQQANTGARGNKYAYFLKTLSRCQEQGIYTKAKALEEAKRKEAEKAQAGVKPRGTDHRSSRPGRPSKEVAAHRYDQREYSDEDLSGLALDLFKAEESKNE
jgi:hypothetical protein